MSDTQEGALGALGPGVAPGPGGHWDLEEHQDLGAHQDLGEVIKASHRTRWRGDLDAEGH